MHLKEVLSECVILVRSQSAAVNDEIHQHAVEYWMVLTNEARRECHEGADLYMCRLIQS